MFGFRDRKKFNTDVDVILRTSFDIETHSSKNPAFPGILRYLGYLDEVWAEKGTAEHAAVRMACLYYMGLAKNGNSTEKGEAKKLRARIAKALPLYVSRGQIAPDRADHYTGLLEKYGAFLGYPSLA